MLDGGLGLLGALGAGGGLGVLRLAGGGIVSLIKARIQAKKEAEIATRESAKDYFDSMNNAKPQEAELEGHSKWEFTIANKKFGYERKYKKETLFTNYLAWCHGTSLLMLIGIVGTVTIIWADNPGIILWASDPSTEPTKVGFAWGLFDIIIAKAKQVREYTTGGVSFMLAHGLIGLAGYLVVGGSRSYKG